MAPATATAGAILVACLVSFPACDGLACRPRMRTPVRDSGCQISTTVRIRPASLSGWPGWPGWPGALVTSVASGRSMRSCG